MSLKCSSTVVDFAGIGAVFSVDTNGNVFFDGTALGSSCSDAMEQGLIRRGDILVAVEGITVRQSTLGKISQQLLGAPNTFVNVTIRRDGRVSTVSLERRRTDRAAMERAMEEAYERAKATGEHVRPIPASASRPVASISPAEVNSSAPLVGPAATAQGPRDGRPTNSVWA
jgi:C-terminal processing protease CtpA/Prc